MSFALTIRTAEDRKAQALADHTAAVAALVDARVEGQARALGYNSAAHLASYTASGVPDWAAEARAFVAWRDAVWLAVFEARAQAGAAGAVPSPEAILERLPDWPDKR
jgi:hypothetical protein